MLTIPMVAVAQPG